MTNRLLSICILSSAHDPRDERICHHFARTLSLAGHTIHIICSTKKLQQEIDGVRTDSFDGEGMGSLLKIKTFQKLLFHYQPDVVISQEPVPNLAAWLYKRQTHKTVRIVYDITEWHPSRGRLERTSNPAIRLAKGIGLAAINLFSAMWMDAFIFGESSKRFPYRYLFPFKKWTTVSYYPDERLFGNIASKRTKTEDEWVLGYTGFLNERRGVLHFLRAVCLFCDRHPSKKIRLLLIGAFANEALQHKFETEVGRRNNLRVSLFPTLSLTEFCQKIHKMDICFDLRPITWESKNSLPIKLFYYMACGKPVIYSRLDAISKDVTDILEFGKLVTPENSEEVVKAMEEYVLSPERYQQHSQRAYDCYYAKYNWQLIAPQFVRFIEQLAHD